MAKNPLITDEIRNLITEVYLTHRDYQAKEVQTEVHVRLQKANSRVTPDWPGLSAVQKELAKIRKSDKSRPPELKELDRPWTIGSLIDHEIHPEVLPKVIEVVVDRLLGDFAYLTIRQALWVARLAFVWQDLSVQQNRDQLYLAAMDYSRAEQVAEITDVNMAEITDDDTMLYEHMYQALGKPLSHNQLEMLRIWPTKPMIRCWMR